MKNKLQKWWKRMFLTCEEVTPFFFDTPEGKKLGIMENLKLNIHRLVCIWCRRYYKQTKFLRKAMKNHQKKSAENVLLEKKPSVREN